SLSAIHRIPPRRVACDTSAVPIVGDCRAARSSYDENSSKFPREKEMKRSSSVLAVLAVLLAAVVTVVLATISLAAQAQVLPGPVLQQVQVPVNRARIPNSGTGPVFVRYILIDPGNADPVRDGFMPLERVAVLVLYIGGGGALNPGAGQVNTGSPNTVARNRYHFAAEGFVVAVVDAANDFNISPIGLGGRRLGSPTLADSQAHIG